MNRRRLAIVLVPLLALSLVFLLLVIFPPGLRRYRAETGIGPVLSGVVIPSEVASDLYDLLGPAVGLVVHSEYGSTAQTVLLSPYGVAGIQPGIFVEPSTVFEMSQGEYLHWCQRAQELVLGGKPKAIYVDAVFSFLFDVKVRPFWKKAGLVALATKHAV